MEFEFVPMTLDYADQMKTWKYNGHVKSLYLEPYFSGHDEATGQVKGPGGCDGFAALSHNRLAGLFEYYFSDEIMEIGLALSPDFKGKGYGKDFVLQGVDFGVKKFDYNKDYVKLTVNIENKPAVRAYEKAGFFLYLQKSDDLEMRKPVTQKMNNE